MGGSTAICFVLANPGPDGPGEGPHIEPAWSSARRQGFGAGLRACIQSIRRRHRFVPPIVVLRPESRQLTLADVDEVIPFDPAPYESIRGSGYFGREVFYKLEVFRPRGYDRVLYLDCDTIVLDDIAPLWDDQEYADKPFHAVRESRDMGVHPAVVGKFNTGVMLINRPLLADGTYRRLLAIARIGLSYDGGDQGVINDYLGEPHNIDAGELDSAYNVLVRARRFGHWDIFKDRIKILHYVNRRKPWASDHHRDWLFDPDFKRLWDEAYRW
jgi:hypothetical protein